MNVHLLIVEYRKIESTAPVINIYAKLCERLIRNSCFKTFKNNAREKYLIKIPRPTKE